MSPLRKSTIKEQVYDLVKERILNRTYQFGEKINMLELSHEFQISNAPIREALAQLESERLISFAYNSSPCVIQITPQIFGEVQETAKIFLIGSYEQCLQQGRIPALLERMETLLQEQKSYLSVDTEESYFAFAKCSIEFDVSLIKVLGNKTLESLYSAFFHLLYMVVLYDHQEHKSDRLSNISEHEQIFKAIKEGDANEVKTKITAHFSRSHKIM